jgi:alkanesulfonate monooxygenase SsuD/methylene tetrahydromethanopterin reductase-like flavin-dependent oxidoreductase (luciferase family)
LEISVMIESAIGVNWPIWKRVTSEVESLGFAGLFCSDHFTVPTPVNLDAMEMIVALSYVAGHTERIHFGPLVAPLSFRDPRLLARQAAQLSLLSTGRMILGVGSGWMEREHEMFGYDLGSMNTRMNRLEEGLQVITLLLRSQEPVTFEGRFYQLHDAVLEPRPAQGPPIMIGGSGPRRTLPLVAQYADVWNGLSVSPEKYRALSQRLDELLLQAGRQPGDVKRTAMVPVVCGRNEHELADRLRGLQRMNPERANLSDADLVERMRSQGTAAVGTPEECVEQLRAYQQAGVQEVMTQFFTVDDFEGIQLLAQEILPHFAG